MGIPKKNFKEGEGNDESGWLAMGGFLQVIVIKN